MEEVLPHLGLNLGPEIEALRVPSGAAIPRGKAALPLDFDCLVRAVADREARPGLK